MFNLIAIYEDGKKAFLSNKKITECPYNDEGSWDEKHSRNAWLKGFNSASESAKLEYINAIDSCLEYCVEINGKLYVPVEAIEILKKKVS